MFEKIVKSIEFDGKRNTFIHCCSFQIQDCFLYFFHIIFILLNEFGWILKYVFEKSYLLTF